MKEPQFLTLAEVVQIPSNQIERYGGTLGVRDQALLQSALAQPEASFGGEWLHEDLFEMAAAYLFHLCQNHPFLDGNKRTAFVAAHTFLQMNGICILDPKEKLYEVVVKVAGGQLPKKDLAQILRKFPREDD